MPSTAIADFTVEAGVARIRVESGSVVTVEEDPHTSLLSVSVTAQTG